MNSFENDLNLIERCNNWSKAKQEKINKLKEEN